MKTHTSATITLIEEPRKLAAFLRKIQQAAMRTKQKEVKFRVDSTGIDIKIDTTTYCFTTGD